MDGKNSARRPPSPSLVSMEQQALALERAAKIGEALGLWEQLPPSFAKRRGAVARLRFKCAREAMLNGQWARAAVLYHLLHQTAPVAKNVSQGLKVAGHKAARAAESAHRWGDAAENWKRLQDLPLDEVSRDKISKQLERCSIRAAREAEGGGEFANAAAFWVSALSANTNSQIARKGALRTLLRAARLYEKQGKDTDALPLWRAMFQIAPSDSVARKGIERLALRLARAAEAEENWSAAADCWRVLETLNLESKRIVEGLKRSLLRLARVAEENHDWAAGMALWGEIFRISPNDKRGEKGILRCASHGLGSEANPATAGHEKLG